ncbi:MAG: hypothetical protein Pg6A_02710 [Termitinemataceae bacterium]|jgi:hypothetical protein|nr:MAG: hypothetical protein Pg6A_02710 [Termitinemataceae bacterium]
MEHLRIETPYLESRTTAELIALGASFELRFPEWFDRNQIIEILLEYAPCLRFYQQHTRINLPEFHDFFEQPNTQLELPMPNPLPKQYNITFVDALVRDPFWVLAIWEISAYDRKQCEKKTGFSGYSLRIRHEGRGEDCCVHIAQISERDTMRYLNFPAEVCHRPYIVELCAIFRGEQMTIATSGTFTLPKSIPPFDCSEDTELQTPIMQLSGIEELRVVRGAL